MVALGGGMCGCSGGHAWLLRGGVWLLPGGMCGCSGGGMRVFFDEIRSMSGQYASYWNAFLFLFDMANLDSFICKSSST